VHRETDKKELRNTQRGRSGAADNQRD